jgi:hypothetical protein
MTSTTVRQRLILNRQSRAGESFRYRQMFRTATSPRHHRTRSRVSCAELEVPASAN